MDRFFFLATTLLLFGCGTGDIGSSNSSSSFNPIESRCTNTCTVHSDGSVSSSVECSNGDSFNVPDADRGDCDSVTNIDEEFDDNRDGDGNIRDDFDFDFGADS